MFISGGLLSGTSPCVPGLGQTGKDLKYWKFQTAFEAKVNKTFEIYTKPAGHPVAKLYDKPYSRPPKGANVRPFRSVSLWLWVVRWIAGVSLACAQCSAYPLPTVLQVKNKI